MTAIRGAVIGFLLGLPISGYLVADNLGEQATTLQVLAALVPCLLATLTGGALGLLAPRFEGRRFLKLLGAALFLYLLDALVIGVLIMFGGASASDVGGVGGQIGGAVMLSVTGSLLFSPIFVPILAGLAFFLERSSRPSAPSSEDSPEKPGAAEPPPPQD
jgi:hypothetical protein